MTGFRDAALVVVVTGLIGGCASGGVHHPAAPQTNVKNPRVHGAVPPAHTPITTKARRQQAAGDAAVGRAIASAAPPSAVAPTPSGSASPQPPGPRPTESEVPVHQGVPLHATLSGTCVRPGATQRISIVTQPKSGVVYDAVYSDGKYGGTANYYGGNAGGETDAKGHWSSHWVVAPSTPAGPVRVDVAAATARGNGYVTVWFHVADSTGRCSR